MADQLSLHHDSQFSAFSTEVFDRANQKHNRSSSPFTTLAEQTERKVANTGAGQPNYWPKRHDLEPMHIMQYSGRRSLLWECLDFLFTKIYMAE